MANCDFCGKEISIGVNTKKDPLLKSGTYCEECSKKDLNDLFEEILNEEESDEDI
ncbi:Uncharacterised protein [uncultured archaeon]|nr:Uncharacterised protein [uncultured archaeon]